MTGNIDWWLVLGVACLLFVIVSIPLQVRAMIRREIKKDRERTG